MKTPLQIAVAFAIITAVGWVSLSFSATTKMINAFQEITLPSTSSISTVTMNSPFQAFNETNPHEDSWCPESQCNNSPMCTPCNRRYLFIVASGRSGSTTLLKMLNYLPNVRISGENTNVLYYASRIVSYLRDPVPLLNQDFDRVEGAYMHNAIAPQSMACALQQIIYTINPPPKKIQLAVNGTSGGSSPPMSIQEYDKDTILGVKTIRLHKVDKWSVEKVSSFLQENFPCSRVIVNIRSDIESQMNSINATFQEGHKPPDLSAKIIRQGNEFLTKLSADLGPQRARLIDMIDWTKDVNILNDVVSWLGFQNCTFHAVVHENTGSSGFGRDHTTDSNLGNQCRYIR